MEGQGPDAPPIPRSAVQRFTVSVVCDMKYGRFPFDQQECALNLESCAYCGPVVLLPLRTAAYDRVSVLCCAPGLDDADDLVLHWASKPRGDRLRLDSFFLRGWVQEAERAAKLNISAPDNYDLLDRFGGQHFRFHFPPLSLRRLSADTTHPVFQAAATPGSSSPSRSTDNTASSSWTTTCPAFCWSSCPGCPSGCTPTSFPPAS